jgi:hypothetical protein
VAGRVPGAAVVESAAVKQVTLTLGTDGDRVATASSTASSGGSAAGGAKAAPSSAAAPKRSSSPAKSYGATDCIN